MHSPIKHSFFAEKVGGSLAQRGNLMTNSWSPVFFHLQICFLEEREWKPVFQQQIKYETNFQFVSKCARPIFFIAGSNYYYNFVSFMEGLIIILNTQFSAISTIKLYFVVG